MGTPFWIILCSFALLLGQLFCVMGISCQFGHQRNGQVKPQQKGQLPLGQILLAV